MSNLTEAINEYSKSEYGHTDWGWISIVDKEELENRDHTKEGDVVFFTEPDEDHE